MVDLLFSKQFVSIRIRLALIPTRSVPSTPQSKLFLHRPWLVGQTPDSNTNTCFVGVLFLFPHWVPVSAAGVFFKKKKEEPSVGDPRNTTHT